VFVTVFVKRGGEGGGKWLFVRLIAGAGDVRGEVVVDEVSGSKIIPCMVAPGEEEEGRYWLHL
jgi:hypothetical protein